MCRPMQWGYAVSTDLLHWEHKEIALYPDELGYIFSGSCVLDVENRSGFGSKDNPPLIAIYTNHAPDNGLAGICECPDCFCIETEQGQKWILSISMIVPEDSHKETHVMQYYAGNFDGNTYHAEQKAQILDHGTDNYAAVTFKNTKQPIGTEAFPLVEVPQRDGIWRMHICYDKEYQLKWETPAGAKIELIINDTNVITKRTHHGETEAALLCGAPRLLPDSAQLDIIADDNLVEIFAENGLISMTVKLW